MSAMRQPRHRRPSWMRDANTYRIHIESDAQRRGTSEVIDPDLEGYCYNPEHYPAWALTSPLREKLPRKFVGLIDDWSYAAAAVQTALGRIEMLDHEGMDRGWPEKTSAHLSRTTSDLTSLCSPSPPSSATSPPMGSFSSQGDVNLPPPYAAAQQTSPGGSAPAVIESPPWTPDDAKTELTLYDSAIAGHCIDPLKLNERLSRYERTYPTSSAGDASPLMRASSACFDGPSWERYLDEYKREMDGVQKEDLPRLRHLAHKIAVDYRLMLAEGKSALDADTQGLFDGWWGVMCALQSKVQDDVGQVSMPTLTEIKHVRRVYGLPV